MSRKKIINLGQAIVEYITIILIILVAFLAMKKYYERSLQGKVRQAADAVSGGEQADSFTFNLN